MFLLRKEMIIALVVFLIYGWQDLKTRSVSVPVLILGAAAGIALAALEQREAAEVLPALLPGLCLAGLSFATGGALGLGDGIATMILGLYLSFGSVLSVLVVGMLMAAMVSLVQIIRHSFDRNVSLKKGLPFLSFYPPAICLTAMMLL